VAVREDRIRTVRGLQRTRGAGRLLGVSEAAGAMVWGVPARFVHLLPPLLAHVERRHPHVRIVLPER
jgi:DNA-binding transcriptional LysR family regulator